MQVTYEAHTDLVECVEDMVEYVCDQHMLSGEAAYAIIECLAVAKQAQLKGMLAAS